MMIYRSAYSIKTEENFVVNVGDVLNEMYFIPKVAFENATDNVH